MLGGEAFKNGVNLFKVTQDLMNFIAYPDRRVIGGPAISNKERIKNAILYLNTAYNQLASYRAHLGSNVQTLQNTQQWLAELNLSTNQLRELDEKGDVLTQGPLNLDQSKRALEATFASLNTVLSSSVVRLSGSSSP
jgi:hypothetical protein